MPVALLMLAAAATAQVNNGKENVNKLCGCFEVEFKYAETFSPDKNYKFHEREKISAGKELALPIEVSDKKIVIQHLLVISDSVIIKHWRDEWTFENPTIWKYKGDNTWQKTLLDPAQVKNSWTQTVWEVSDAPRYQGSSNWVTTNSKTFWQNTTDAPLPRREYSQRSDYNILKRQNSIIITDSGWIHDQDNQKIIRTNGVDRLLAQEKGINTYKRTADSKCAAAKAFWQKNEWYWSRVRIAWQNYLATHNSIYVRNEVDGLLLHNYLNEQAADLAAGRIKAADVDAAIKMVLDKFISEKK
jgi:hypothetical protein